MLPHFSTYINPSQVFAKVVRGEKNLAYVEALVNGKPVMFLVSIEAKWTSISYATAKSAGIPLSNLQDTDANDPYKKCHYCDCALKIFDAEIGLVGNPKIITIVGSCGVGAHVNTMRAIHRNVMGQDILQGITNCVGQTLLDAIFSLVD